MNAFTKYLKPEEQLHVSVCNYIRAKYPAAVIHHSPNEGKRTPFEQYRIKQLGTSAGFPDLFIVLGEKTIAIELKAATYTAKGKMKPGKATDKQLAWIDRLNAAGIPAKVCTGIDEAMAFIDKHFKNK